MSSLDERAAIELARTLGHPPVCLLSLDEFAARPSVAYLVRDLIPVESIVVTFGAPKSGKTYAILDLSMHTAHGMHWHGYTVSRPLRVAYLAGEGHSGLRVRVHAWRRYHEAELRGDMRIIAQSLPLADCVADVIDVLREYSPDLLVIDTLNAFFGGADENSTKDMTAFMAAVRQLRDELHASVIIIHHTGLADASRERGSSVLRGAADVIVQVARDEAGSGLIGMQVIGARDMEPWSEALSLRLVPADTDWADEDGQPISTCIVAAGDAPVSLPGRAGKPLGDAQQRLLEVVLEMARGRRNGSSDVRRTSSASNTF